MELMVLRHAKVILPVIAGGVAGAVATLIVSRTPSGQGHAEVPRPSAAPTVVYIPRFVEPAIPFAENPSHASDSDQARPPREDIRHRADPRVEDDFAENRKNALARHDKAIEAHRGEPLDAKWAQKTEAAFKSDLTKLGSRNGFAVVSVDCRTTTCTSTLEWSRYDTAVNSWRQIVTGSYETNCAKEILLPGPDEPSVPYRATVVFDCESAISQER
jgi:hypothetical protein